MMKNSFTSALVSLSIALFANTQISSAVSSDTLLSPWTNHGLCLNLNDDNSTLLLVSCSNDRPSQRWTFADGILVSQKTGQCVDVTYADEGPLGMSKFCDKGFLTEDIEFVEGSQTIQWLGHTDNNSYCITILPAEHGQDTYREVGVRLCDGTNDQKWFPASTYVPASGK